MSATVQAALTLMHAGHQPLSASLRDTGAYTQYPLPLTQPWITTHQVYLRLSQVSLAGVSTLKYFGSDP
jgi:hypothetical protein